MVEQENSNMDAKAFAGAHPPKAKEKYGGLFACPATDGNFSSGLGRLNDGELQKFYDALVEREAEERCHKGRIKAVEKEMKARATTSAEGRALVRMDEDIKAAEELYADGTPYELERIENELRFYKEQAGSAFLEMGKRLIRVKAHEGHGGFLKTLENLEMAPRSAQHMMAAARRFSNAPTWAHLESSKLKALSVLDDDEIEKLERGEPVRGVTVDRLHQMSVRELRETVKKGEEALKKEKEGRKKDREAQDAAIARKEAEISGLDQRLRYQQPPTKEQAALAALMKMNMDYTLALARINAGLREARKIVYEAEKTPGTDVQMLSEWLGQFDPEMGSFHTLKDEWLAEVDNAFPVKAGEIELPSDKGGALPESWVEPGEGPLDVPGLD